MAVQSNSASSISSHARLTEPLQDQGLFPDNARLISYRRLIVLVPKTHINEQRLIERTINLASLNRAEVLFLGLSANRSETADAHHRLGVLASKARRGVVAYSQVLPDADWIAALRMVLSST